MSTVLSLTFHLHAVLLLRLFSLLWDRKSINCASLIEGQYIWHKLCPVLLYTARLGDFSWLVTAIYKVTSEVENTISRLVSV
jgi:hypothetical protein